MLRKITEKDLEFARELRNSNRECFFNQRVVKKKDQKKWFEIIQQFDNYHFYIIWSDKTKVGTISCRESEKGNMVEVGNIIIDKKYRKKGYLKQAIDEVEKLYPGRKIFLKVIPANTTAIIAYEALGFKEKERILWKYPFLSLM